MRIIKKLRAWNVQNMISNTFEESGEEKQKIQAKKKGDYSPFFSKKQR